MSEGLAEHDYTFPNKMSRILLQSMHDVMGATGIAAVLTTARLAHLIDQYPPADFSPGLHFDDVAQLLEAVEGIYGVRGGRRLLRQSGHACFRYGVEGFGATLGLVDLLLRILPMNLRVHIGLEVLAEILSRYSGFHVSLSQGTQSFFFVMERCGFCFGRHVDSPACAVTVGLIEEMLYWVSRGERFTVEETTCIGCGDPVCTVMVDRIPSE